MRNWLARGALSVVAVLLVGGLFRLYTGLDVVTREYGSYRAAAEDNLFGGGWMPDFVPASAADIAVTADLDLNTARGSFRYAPADTPAFLENLDPWGGGPAPFTGHADRLAEMKSAGYRPYKYAGERSTWLFYVNRDKGRVHFDMWPKSALESVSGG